MKFVRESLVLVAQLCLAGAVPLLAQISPLLPSQKAPLSNRVVAYQIEATYNPKNHSLDARETLTWTNYTGVPQDRLPFHLYLNAFQPKSTFTREGYESGNRDVEVGAKWEDKKFGEDAIKSFEVVGMGDLTDQLRKSASALFSASTSFSVVRNPCGAPGVVGLFSRTRQLPSCLRQDQVWQDPADLSATKNTQERREHAKSARVATVIKSDGYLTYDYSVVPACELPCGEWAYHPGHRDA